MLYDISPPLNADLAVWPGDPRFAREVRSSRGEEVTITSSTLHTTAHIGSHADAPAHYRPDGATIDQVALEAYLGPCEVRRIEAPRGAAITPDLCGEPPGVSRVLFATGTYPDPTTFNPDFAGLSAELVDWLADAGVQLVGIDTPSIDPYAAADLPAHRRIGDRGLLILEGLRLENVPPGEYELIALPLRIAAGDGSPVRAALRSLPRS